MAFLGGLMELIAEAGNNAARMPAALMSLGVTISAAALALIIFKAPGGVFLHLHGAAPEFVYYGILIAVASFGLAEASFGFWVVPRDLNGWRGAGKAVLWASAVALVLVAALGGLAFLK
ncbi:hypothetical protein EJB05_00856, partial [Eragrostis curvula]